MTFAEGFLFLRRMAGPPVGSAMPARHSTQYIALRGVLKHAKLAGVMSPASKRGQKLSFSSIGFDVIHGKYDVGKENR